jgi:DegV family protein with EDD domain
LDGAGRDEKIELRRAPGFEYLLAGGRMRIVTDRGADLSDEQMKDLCIRFAPMRLLLDGKTYSSGEDVTPAEFYEILAKSDGFPSTSQATAGDFAAIYREVAQEDPEILSIHISAGLSGTMSSAKMGAEMVPEAKVTFWDTKTLSCPEGWQVEVAARALMAGWSMEEIFARLDQLRIKTVEMFTLDTMKYLIHGGRISHMKGLLASLLHIRPIIGVDNDSGKYIQMGQERTMKRAVEKMVEILGHTYAAGTELRVQLMHGINPEMLAVLNEALEKMFRCRWLPTISVAPILGAHTGLSVVAFCAAPVELFEI